MDYGVPEQNVAGYGEEEPQYDEGKEVGNQDSIDNIDDSAGMNHDSSSSAGKLFIGGIAWETSEESFSRYFSKFGEITDSVIMMDKISGRPRGFGFVTFADPDVADKVIQEEHIIDGRLVEVKRTVPREDMHGRGVSRTKKIFVGGLSLSLHEEDLREYFSAYGSIVEIQIMLDHETGRSRGFGFVTFNNEDAVDKILSSGRMHELGGKKVEIKRAEPKRSSFDNSRDSRYHRGSNGSKPFSNFGGGSEAFSGGYGGKMARGYGGYEAYNSGYGGYGNFPGNYAGSAAGFYAGYGGYGYGYGFGGGMYSGGAYGGGGFGAPVGYGGPGTYGMGKGYSGPGGGYTDGGNGFGPNSGDGVYGSSLKGYGSGGGSGGGGGYGSGKGHGNGSISGGGRFHPYRK